MSQKIIRIATRKSPLALWQANFIGSCIKEYWPDVDIQLVPMLTTGDTFLKDKLATIGGKGLFVKELEEAMLQGEADIAVHSMKDVPTTLPEGLTLAAICKRNNPLDAFISSKGLSLQALPPKSKIGTSSPRRQFQLKTLRPDCDMVTLRGNVGTRLTKLDTGELDAIILAAAGLERLGLNDRITHILNEEEMLPAAGQGALGIECRQNDADMLQRLACLNDHLTEQCVMAERQVNALLGGNCHVPLAVYCKPLHLNSLETNQATQVLLRAKIISADGKVCLEEALQGPMEEAINLAKICADKLCDKGAKALLALA
jgi:hydroxymethylbilane synthase